MADRHASLPTPINTTRTTNNSGQRREASTPTSATTQHSGGLTAAPSPATPVNPSTPDPALFGRLVEILSANANGCIQEMGYPAVWENLVNLQKAYGELQRREMQLRQHASNLARLLQDSQKNIGMLKEENIMLRNNAPEAYRVLEAKYFYVLEKLQQEHTPIMIDEQQPPQAQQGPGPQTTSQSNYPSGVGQPYVPSNVPHLHTVPMGPPPHAARKFAQQQSHPSQSPSVLSSHSQPVIPAKRTMSDTGSASSPSIGLPPSLSRKPALHPPQQPSSSSAPQSSSAYPPNALRTDHTNHPNSISAAASSQTSNERPFMYSLRDDSWKTNRPPAAKGFPSMSNTQTIYTDQSRPRTMGAIANPHMAAGPSGSLPPRPPSNPSTPVTATPSGQIRPSTAGATAPSGSTNRGVVPPPLYPVPIDGVKKFDTRALARSVINALQGEARGDVRRPSGSPVVQRLEANKRNAEQRVSATPAKPDVQRHAQPATVSVASPVPQATPAVAPPPPSVAISVPLPAAAAPAPPTTAAPIPAPAPPVPAPAPAPAPVVAPMPVAAPMSVVAPMPMVVSPPVVDKAGKQEKQEVKMTQITPSQNLSNEIAMGESPFTTNMNLSNKAIAKESPTITEAFDRQQSAVTAVTQAEAPLQVSTSSTIMAMEVDLPISNARAEHIKRVASSDSHATEAMEMSDVEAPNVEDNAEEEPEEEWGDLTDDEAENDSAAGKLSVVECLSSIFYDDEQDERFCQLCNTHIETHNLSDPKPTFSDCSMRDLITHAKEVHPITWERLRQHKGEDLE